jgi:hypothetical protein
MPTLLHEIPRRNKRSLPHVDPGLLFFVLFLFCSDATAKQINGSIHFHNENSHVFTRTFSNELHFTQLGCSTFTLSIAASVGDARVLLLDDGGNQLGVFEYGEKLDASDCGKDTYRTILVFDRPQTIQWTRK